MTLIQKEIKAVYLWDTKVRPTTPATVTVTDSTNATWTNTSLTNGAYQWLTFTALKTWKITRVGFIYAHAHSATLKIAQWAYASASWTTYSYTADSSWEYELPTPFEITEWTTYSVSVNTWTSNLLAYQYPWSLPITWTAVRYDYSTYSWNTTQYTTQIWAIKSLTIEYTP